MSYIDYLITYEMHSIERKLDRLDRISDMFEEREKVFDLKSRYALLEGIQKKLVAEYLTYPLNITE